MQKKLVSLSDQDVEAVQADAKRNGVSFSEMLRRLIARFYREAK